MSRKRIFAATHALIVGAALLALPTLVLAQHHGGGHGMGGSMPGGSNRPSGLSEKDTLKDFHHALAVQATSEQIAEFQALLKSTKAAKADVDVFSKQVGKENGKEAPKGSQAASRESPLDQSVETARAGNKRFLDGFSAAQKSGLKEVMKRIVKADSDLELEVKKLDQSLAVAEAAPEVTAKAESLSKVLSDFYDQQLALGREMSIVLANGQDLAFTLPQVKIPVTLGDQSAPITVSGVLSQTSVDDDQRTFRLELVNNLSNLQQNITALLRAQLDRSDLCGQRVAIRQATLTPSTPGALLVVLLHYERWTCSRMYGQQVLNELAESDGSVELKLTAAVGESNTLKLHTEFGRIEANGIMADALRSGFLGDALRDKSSELVLTAMRAGADFKTTLPPAVQNSVTVQSAKFQDANIGEFSVVLGGQIQISNEQANQLASQLNQSLSAQANQPVGNQPHSARSSNR
jgi:hypothetical protein